MKFGKRLASQMEETLPEWRDKFLSYKQLKKRLKGMSAPDCFTEAAFESPDRTEACSVVDAAVDELELKRSAVRDRNLVLQGPTEIVNKVTQNQVVQKDNTNDSVNAWAAAAIAASQEEVQFTNLLEEELEKFNSFFIEKEEEYVIRLQELKDRIEALKAKDRSNTCGFDLEHQEELIEIRRDIVTFHGEMVLLFNYSSLNYTGLVKILKKYDKRTGMSLRLPFIQRVLHQPFFTTELLSKLVQECEKNLQSIFPPDAEIALLQPLKDEQEEQQQQQILDSKTESEGEVESIYRSTMAALQTIKDLRKGSSTYSPLSLPPLNSEEQKDS